MVNQWFRSRLARGFLYSFLGLLALVILFYVEEDLRGWHAWHAFKQGAKGDRFDFASIVPPPVPDDQNFALTPIVASCYQGELAKAGKKVVSSPPRTGNRLKMGIYGELDSGRGPATGNWARGQSTDLVSWQAYYRKHGADGFPVAPASQSPAADVLLALSRYDSDIEELRQASQLPYSRFPINYDPVHPYDILLGHLSSLKACSQTIQLRSVAELEAGQSDKAFDDVKLSFRLANATRGEPFLISDLVRLAQLQIAFQTIWEGLVNHRWSDAQLASMEDDLGNLDFLADCRHSIAGERNESLSVVDSMRRNRSYADFSKLYASGLESKRKPWLGNMFRAMMFHLIPSGWFYHNEVTMGRMYQQCTLPMIDPVKHQAYPKIEGQADKFIRSLSRSPKNYFVMTLMPALASAERKYAYGQETVDLARLACALERYRLAHGDYPPTLDDLTPQFIDKIPGDVVGGGPLHYRPTDNGKFLLYSVGWNETDDDGKPALRMSGKALDDSKGDWVWPMPSK